MSTKTKAKVSGNPDYPDADPTAPGGMSQKALVKELVETHDYEQQSVKQLSWPEMIDLVVQSRLEREDESRCDLHELIHCAECNGTATAHDASLEDDDSDVFDTDGATASTDAVGDELDDLLAEFEEASTVRSEALAEEEAAKPESIFIGLPNVRDYIYDGHFGSGPSQSERYLTCTASMEASREFLETLSPNQQLVYANANTAARQGTTAHSAAETEVSVLLGTISEEEAEHNLLELAIMPDDVGECYDADMAEYIHEYVDLAQQYINEGRDVAVEVRVEAGIPLTSPLPNGDEVYYIPGSADIRVLPSEDDNVLVVGDLKYGNGIFVDVDENPQVRIYALGVLGELADPETGELPDIDRLEYHIIQPRMGGIRTWTESLDDLLTWRDEVLSPALTAALLGVEGGAVFAPSEVACQWCPARGACAALAEQRVTEAAELFDTIVEAEFTDGPGAFPETAMLTDTRLGELFAQIRGLISIHDDLKEEAQRRLHRGGTIPGFKLVSYTPPRKWKPEADTDESLAALPVWKPQALLTPTQAIKVLGEEADKITDLIDVPDKRPVVAPEGDRRKDWTGTPPEQMFEVEGGDDD